MTFFLTVFNSRTPFTVALFLFYLLFTKTSSNVSAGKKKNKNKKKKKKKAAKQNRTEEAKLTQRVEEHKDMKTPPPDKNEAIKSKDPAPEPAAHSEQGFDQGILFTVGQVYYRLINLEWFTIGSLEENSERGSRRVLRIVSSKTEDKNSNTNRGKL